MNRFKWLTHLQRLGERANARGMGITLGGLPESDLHGIYWFLCRWES
jgi:hypothetical protein